MSSNISFRKVAIILCLLLSIFVISECKLYLTAAEAVAAKRNAQTLANISNQSLTIGGKWKATTVEEIVDILCDKGVKGGNSGIFLGVQNLNKEEREATYQYLEAVKVGEQYVLRYVPDKE